MENKEDLQELSLDDILSEFHDQPQEGDEAVDLGEELNQLLEELPRGADALLIPINGQGYNMNVVDAARLTRFLQPRTVYPMHWDLFKAYGCDVQSFVSQFKEEERDFIKIPAHFQEIAL